MEKKFNCFLHWCVISKKLHSLAKLPVLILPRMVKVQLFFTLVCNIKNTSFSGRVFDFAYKWLKVQLFFT